MLAIGQIGSSYLAQCADLSVGSLNFYVRSLRKRDATLLALNAHYERVLQGNKNILGRSGRRGLRVSDFYNERPVKKTRKDHRCFGCRGKIPVGSKCFYISWVNEGEFGANYLCTKCKKYLDKNPEFDRDGYYEGDIRDAMLEDAEWRKERERFL